MEYNYIRMKEGGGFMYGNVVGIIHHLFAESGGLLLIIIYTVNQIRTGSQLWFILQNSYVRNRTTRE